MKILSKEDFKIKPGYKYYYFEDLKYLIEIDLEPCLNGFDVGLYRAKFSGPKNKDIIFYPSLIRDKECTNENDYGDSLSLDRIRHQDPWGRSSTTWEHALKIANKFYQSYINEYKLKELKILPYIDKNFTFTFC